jgi:hypothetical protein
MNILQRSVIDHLHTQKNSSSEQKECVFKYFLKSAVNFAFSFLRNCQTVWSTVDKFDVSMKCTFFENKISWCLVCEDGV